MLKFDLARNALEYLITHYKIKEIYIPYYLCDVVRHSVVKTGCKPIFYHIDDNFMPAQEFMAESFILYPNYFGVCSKNVEKLIWQYPRLIVDNAHAFYANPCGFASFNSSRKFLPKNEGAFLWLGEGENPYKPNFNRRKIFDKFDKIFGKDNCLKFELKDDDIPFCYPYLAKTIEKADKIANMLQAQGKVIYRYWGNLPKSYNEYKFYSRLVPIPLDD